MAILHVVQNWHPYLLGNHFCIKTDHQSLKYFLEQCVSSPTQQKWVSKLMGYDYEITYKKGKDNLVVDALSHTFDDHISLSAISMHIPNWLQSIQQGYVNESSLSEIIQQLANNPSEFGYWQSTQIYGSTHNSQNRSHNFTQKLKNETIQKQIATVNDFIDKK